MENKMVMPNRLGDLIAENDSSMLDSAFLETPDYKTILESDEKVIVVGRRGTGKSALTYKLKADWEATGNEKNIVMKFSPSEDQVIGLRPILKAYGEKYELIRAAVKLAWEAVLLLEMVDIFSKHYKFEKTENHIAVKKIAERLLSRNQNVAFNLRKLLQLGMQGADSPEEAIAELSAKLRLNELRDFITLYLKGSKLKVKILIDCLDEGYEPDLVGIAYVSGIVQATVLVKNKFLNVRPLLFIRDNMFRAVSREDPDYTRNIEGSSMRLHWGENELLYLTALRLRKSFSLEGEKDVKIWNQCTTGDISERSGFKKCLRLTLYRPRDLIALLNQAFYSANRRQSARISLEDIEATSKEISQTRLDDLIKEYTVIFPSLAEVVGRFKGRQPTFTFSELTKLLDELINDDEISLAAQRDLAFYDTAEELIKSLHSIGFLGIKDNTTDIISFSHDGKDTGLSLDHNTVFHIHPCYQIALNAGSREYSQAESEEIHDDYEIHVSSLSREQRNRKVGQLISRLQEIDLGADDASSFENWCFEAIKIVFAGRLENVRLHPNKNAPQRRDVVGTNNAKDGVWKRVFEDYNSRVVLFEIKNYEELSPDDYRQIASYLTDKHGSIGFLIFRSNKKEPSNENELVWIREMYWKSDPKKLIVLLSYKHLVSFLGKVRNPQKHDAVDKILGHILDDYHDKYLNEQSGSKGSSSRRQRNKRGSNGK